MKEITQEELQSLQEAAEDGAKAIQDYLLARFQSQIEAVMARQDHLIAGIEAQALNGAARSISSQQATPGKPR